MTSKYQPIGLSILLLGLSSVSGLAQPPNFGSLTISTNHTSGRLSGTIAGATSLPAIVSNTDLHQNKCLGFGDPNPDHTLILKQDMPLLTLQVNSGGADTTLVVQGSDGSVRCGDDTDTNKDARITDTNWKLGTYKVWVGAKVPGVRRDYTLTIRQ
ncbi:hypothetical protein [Pantanalinema sp. GBBB05]|uniref:hypothetical protein n=1 Tax=Pantanalinema sp. GBBB05 TaxID=2604139 RepID=UPI001E0E1069|nr:hypothetical protein [Pantanalinema sp. GBBB05]